jgi:hypothetical protein
MLLDSVLVAQGDSSQVLRAGGRFIDAADQLRQS